MTATTLPGRILSSASAGRRVVLEGASITVSPTLRTRIRWLGLVSMLSRCPSMRTSAASFSGVSTVAPSTAIAGGCGASPPTLKTAFVRIGFPGVTAGNPATCDDGPGAEALRLFGFHPDGARCRRPRRARGGRTGTSPCS